MIRDVIRTHDLPKLQLWLCPFRKISARSLESQTARVNKLILVLRIRTFDKTNRWNLDTVLNIPQRTGSVPVGEAMYSLSLDHRYDN